MYYPKSKIIPDQYTNGDKLIYASSKLFYTGYYHILANNQIFTGKNPTDGNPQLLIFPSQIDSRPQEIQDIPIITDEPENYTFGTSGLDYDLIRTKNNIQPPPTSLLEPKYTSPSVQYPSFIRYFVKRTNNSVFTEIDKLTFDKIISKDKSYNWPMYVAFELPWTTGGASTNTINSINKGIVEMTELRLKLYGLSKYITNYTEFAI